jgi:hypothetical protein
MLAHNVIILTSGRATAIATEAIDSLILALRKLKKNPILVLGPDGDDILRLSQQIENCEIIFDPNYEGEIFSGIKAGLETTNAAAFICAINEPILDPATWADLERALFSEDAKSVHVFSPLTQDSIPRYPQLVTAHGVRLAKTLPALSCWADLCTNGALRCTVVSMTPSSSLTSNAPAMDPESHL